MPRSAAARAMRMAISPRLAISRRVRPIGSGSYTGRPARRRVLVRGRGQPLSLTVPEPARSNRAMAWGAAGAIETAKRAFFRSFFRLLLGFIALAEWVCVAWVLLAAGLRPPRALHILAPLAIFQLNRWLVTRRPSDRP